MVDWKIYDRYVEKYTGVKQPGMIDEAHVLETLLDPFGRQDIRAELFNEFGSLSSFEEKLEWLERFFNIIEQHRQELTDFLLELVFVMLTNTEIIQLCEKHPFLQPILVSELNEDFLRRNRLGIAQEKTKMDRLKTALLAEG